MSIIRTMSEIRLQSISINDRFFFYNKNIDKQFGVARPRVTMIL